jgi:quercetin dioxygenase-like cupin family protein
VLENPVTGERAIVTVLSWHEPDGRAAAELTARVGARVVGEHRHPSAVERFTVLEGELTVKLDGRTRILRQGEAAEVQPGRWHDWWNASDRDARVLVEVTPGERFTHMVETLFGLARTGHTDSQGRPDLLQLALFGREFADTAQFKSPPVVVQRALFAALAPLAHAMGYRATYPQFSRTTLAPRN